MNIPLEVSKNPESPKPRLWILKWSDLDEWIGWFGGNQNPALVGQIPPTCLAKSRDFRSSTRIRCPGPWAVRSPTMYWAPWCGHGSSGHGTPIAGWFIIWLVVSKKHMFHVIYGIIPTPLTNSYFSRWLLHHQPVMENRPNKMDEFGIYPGLLRKPPYLQWNDKTWDT